MRKVKLLIVLILIFRLCPAQDRTFVRDSFLTAGLNQINEAANFGLVFKGPGIDFGMSWISVNEKRLFSYEYELGASVLFSREIPALGFYLKPADLGYLFKVPLANEALLIGPSLKFEYNYNLYPDLQAGFDYWFTNISLGIKALYDFNLGKSAFRLKFNSSVAGFLSRQAAYRDPYFYDLGFKYAIRHLNEDLSFGSVGDFNTTGLEILWTGKADQRFAFGYFLNYSGFYSEPEITVVKQGIKVIINNKHK